MTTIEVSPIRDVRTTERELTVLLEDGRSISTPLSYYPRLAHATEGERRNWRLIIDGEGIEWPDLDEHISVEGLIAGRRSGETARSVARWREVQEALRSAAGYRQLRRETIQAGPLPSKQIVDRIRQHVEAFDDGTAGWCVGASNDAFADLKQNDVAEDDDTAVAFEAIDEDAARDAVAEVATLGLTLISGGTEPARQVFVFRRSNT